MTAVKCKVIKCEKFYLFFFVIRRGLMTSFNKNKCGNFSFLGLFFPRTSPGWQSKTKRSLHF